MEQGTKNRERISQLKQKYGILAHPVAHSLSPPMQLAAFRHYHIDAAFERFDILPADLPEFFQRVRKIPIVGLAVSLPHKQAVMYLLDKITATARDIGAVNTVFWDKERLIGDNTDATGFWQALNTATNFRIPRNALVIGAGGAARAIVYVLRKEQVEVSIMNRSPEKAETLARDFRAQNVSEKAYQAADFDLVINATSVGLKSQESPVPKDFWTGFSGVAFDAVFDPVKTKFLQDAQTAGASIITGEKMLLYQGVRQFEIWTGKQSPVEVMKAALEASLLRIN